jgi:hypothetical protein
MKKIAIVVLLLSGLSGCFPADVKEQMQNQMASAQRMFAETEFKKALGQIELHKLRTGIYPRSLSELQFLNQLDSSMSSFVEYTRLDSGYELNVKAAFPSEEMAQEQALPHFPDEFWKGLGCVKSNTK